MKKAPKSLNSAKKRRSAEHSESMKSGRTARFHKTRLTSACASFRNCLLASLAPLWLAAIPQAFALINPSLQPIDFYERYVDVLGLRIDSIDVDKRLVELTVIAICKGTGPKDGKVTISLANDEAAAASDSLLWEGGTVVAFVGKTGRGNKDGLMLYAGSGGQWQLGKLEKPGDLSRWVWDKDLGLSLFGAFNGSSESLLDMMKDARDGRYYFPAKPFSDFGDAIVISKSPEPLMGVALYDLDGDGRPDIVSCSAKNIHIYLQTKPMVFEDRTEALGLTGVAGPSIGIADVNADGAPDLLAGGFVFLGQSNGTSLTFKKADLLPEQTALKSASFVEINGDGYPDIVVSHAGKGLSAYLNPGAKGGDFADATAALGLDKVAADGDGYFAAGDWNGDGRTDLFHSVSMGRILLQDKGGHFTAAANDLEFDPDASGGTAALVPMLNADARNLVLSTDVGVRLLGVAEEKLTDLTDYGNELMETSLHLMAMVAEDLNADGNVDIYVASREAFPAKYYVNRGYGSFMCPNKYKPAIFPPEAQDNGAGGISAGDVNGDGANDLLIAGVDGRLLLLVSHVLDQRHSIDKPVRQEQTLANSKIVSVKVGGKIGVLGAEVSLVDAKGVVECRRTIGSNLVTGCQGPDTVNLVTREPKGAHSVKVRYSDGTTQEWPVDLSGPDHRVIVDAARK